MYHFVQDRMKLWNIFTGSIQVCLAFVTFTCTLNCRVICMCVRHLKLGTHKAFWTYTNVNARRTRVDQSLFKMKQTAIEYFDWLYLEIPNLPSRKRYLEGKWFYWQTFDETAISNVVDKTGCNTVSEIENYGRFISFEWIPFWQLQMVIAFFFS